MLIGTGSILFDSWSWAGQGPLFLFSLPSLLWDRAFPSFVAFRPAVGSLPLTTIDYTIAAHFVRWWEQLPSASQPSGWKKVVIAGGLHCIKYKVASHDTNNCADFIAPHCTSYNLLCTRVKLLAGVRNKLRVEIIFIDVGDDQWN